MGFGNAPVSSTTVNERVQAPPDEDPPSDPGTVVEDASRPPGHAGITIGGWTLRWAGDQWTVGRWKPGSDRSRWLSSGWYDRLDQALRRLLELNVRGDVSDLTEAVDRVEAAYRAIMEAGRVQDRDS